MGHPTHPVLRAARAPLARVAWLAHRVAAWRDDLATPAAARPEELQPVLARFCRAMDQAGVRGPQVRRLAGAVVREAFDGRVADHERERVARAAQGVVDVIYLTGAHQAARPGA